MSAPVLPGFAPDLFAGSRVLVTDAAGAEAAWDEAQAVNTTAPFLPTRALLAVLRGGAVVHVTSARAGTAAAVFLASPLAAFVTGATLAVDGGFSAA